MINLEDRICFAGTVVSRGEEAISLLKQMGEHWGYFFQKDIKIDVYQNSTARELAYQYDAKRKYK